MTVSEAHVILFVGESLCDLCASLRKEQIEALTGVLDMPQKVLFLEIMSTITPPENGGFSASAGKRETWARLVESAKGRIAAGPEGN